MVKIGVIFMPFSNPTNLFRGTADFTDCTDCTAGIFQFERAGTNLDHPKNIIDVV